ncbi:branched-chain amino acid ABC transporter permease [Pseudomonas frederiksbergensis]|uniref:ABC transporter permease n=1 Tax=Pseudomonas frederiksbergensis TaxID=104087 RepID=A0A0B1YSW7_9PSED|nr:branched-chain amino acid ABC transporter permease [Pseudomonas frederiksbergensis]KHK61555.1 ABC transporter permease [Pseudomonas frederiksbergensis]
MIQFIIDVILRSCDLILIAVGMSAIYSLMKFPNIALTQYAVAGALLSIALQKSGVPISASVVVACGATIILATFLNEYIFNPMLKISSSTAMIGSLAVSMLLSAVFLVMVGPNPARFNTAVLKPLKLFGVRVTELQLYSVGITVTALIMFALLLYKTDLGRCVRATSTNALLADATGIDTRKSKSVVVALSALLASLGGITLALKGEVSMQTGTEMLLPVFSAAILGGLGNPLGAIVGALVIATAETLITNINFGPLTGQSLYFLPAAYASAASFLLLVATLLWRPRGIFVNEVKRV